MRLRLLLQILGVVVVAVGTASIYLFGSPRLVEVSPAPDAKIVPAGAPLRLTFSRRMNPESITEKLSIDPNQAGKLTWDGNTLVFTPDGLWPSGQTIQVRLAPGARAAGLISLPLTKGQAWSFTVGQPRLVYLYPSNGPADLYLLNMETGEIEPLTESSGSVLDYTLSADGDAVYFNVNEGDGGSRIYRLDMYTRERRELLACPQALCRYPRPSADESWLAFEQTRLAGQPDYPQVWVMSLKDGETAQPVLAGEEGHETVLPAWSPSDILAFHDDDEQAFILFDPSTGERQSFPSQNGLGIVWSPNGDSLITSAVIAGVKQNPSTLPDVEIIPSSHLLQFQGPEWEAEDLTVRNNLEDASPAYSPDGSVLAFARKYLDIAHWTPGRQLWVMGADGSDPRPLTDEPHHNHYDFAWHPSGGQIAYVRFNQTILTEPPEVWIADVETGRTRLLISGGYSPQWIP